jgi:hypothetical protein
MELTVVWLVLGLLLAIYARLRLKHRVSGVAWLGVILFSPLVLLFYLASKVKL